MSFSSVNTLEIISEKSMASPVELQRYTVSKLDPRWSRSNLEYYPCVSDI